MKTQQNASSIALSDEENNVLTVDTMVSLIKKEVTMAQ